MLGNDRNPFDRRTEENACLPSADRLGVWQVRAQGGFGNKCFIKRCPQGISLLVKLLDHVLKFLGYRGEHLSTFR